MMINFKRIVATAMAAVAFAASPAVAQEASHGEEKLDMNELIGHHISNSHQWDIVAWKGSDGRENVISIPLPVMAVHEGNFLFCMSSSLSGGQRIDNGGVTWYMKHDKLKVDTAEGKGLDPTLDFSLSRNVCSMWLSVVLLLLVFVGTAKVYRNTQVPKGGASLVEMLVLFVKDIGDEQIGKDKSAKYTPYLLTLFFFIWFNNIIGLIPFFPGSTNLSGNIAFTGILAVFTFLVTNWNGTKAYWIHNFTVPGVPAVMKLILVPVEIISLFTKPFTLMIRLFANITGGHIIVLSLMSMIFITQNYVMAVPSVLLGMVIFVLELFFGALQAYIFTLLSALYISLATNQTSHEH